MQTRTQAKHRPIFDLFAICLTFAPLAALRRTSGVAAPRVASPQAALATPWAGGIPAAWLLGPRHGSGRACCSGQWGFPGMGGHWSSGPNPANHSRKSTHPCPLWGVWVTKGQTECMGWADPLQWSGGGRDGVCLPHKHWQGQNDPFFTGSKTHPLPKIG